MRTILKGSSDKVKDILSTWRESTKEKWVKICIQFIQKIIFQDLKSVRFQENI